VAVISAGQRNGPGYGNRQLTINQKGYYMKLKVTPISTSTSSIVLGTILLAVIGIKSSFADITITATPVSTSGSNSVCPGSYIGTATYSKTIAQGWGWVPTNTVHTATDTNRSDTIVYYSGRLLDHGCNQTSVSITNPCPSTAYRFTVYFTNNVPTNPYPIVLQGFMP
jgi:hypothetical protein